MIRLELKNLIPCSLGLGSDLIHFYLGLGTANVVLVLPKGQRGTHSFVRACLFPTNNGEQSSNIFPFTQMEFRCSKVFPYQSQSQSHHTTPNLTPSKEREKKTFGPTNKVLWGTKYENRATNLDRSRRRKEDLEQRNPLAGTLLSRKMSYADSLSTHALTHALTPLYTIF